MDGMDCRSKRTTILLIFVNGTTLSCNSTTISVPDQSLNQHDFLVKTNFKTAENENLNLI